MEKFSLKKLLCIIDEIEQKEVCVLLKKCNCLPPKLEKDCSPQKHCGKKNTKKGRK